MKIAGTIISIVIGQFMYQMFLTNPDYMIASDHIIWSISGILSYLIMGNFIKD